MYTIPIRFACVSVDRIAFYICTGRVPDARDMAGTYVQMTCDNGGVALMVLQR